MIGGEGNDLLDGDGGSDTMLGGGGTDTVIGDFGNDSITGDAGADSLTGGGGNDTVLAGDGADTIITTWGADSLDGGEGNDRIDAGGAGDTVQGSIGNDTILAGDGADRADGGDDNDSVDGSNDNDTLLGGGGDDTVLGGNGADSLDGGLGADSLLGGTDSDTIAGGGGADTLLGESGNDQLFLSGTGGRADGGDNDDLITVASGTTGTVIGGNGTDTIAFGFNGTVNVSGNTVTGPGGLSINATGIDLIRLADGSTTAFGNGSFVVCFVAGTRILTAQGEKPVESLRPGELVATLSGQGSPLKPVVFLGRRRIALAGNPHAAELSPVRIRAGALGPNTPHRDLLVSPDHCLFRDGALVPARLLVNGTSIAVEKGLAEVTYFHIELPAHDVVLAEGAAAESWLDAGNRAWFENAPTALLRVTATPDAYAHEEAQPCAPVIQAGPRLAAIRDRIALHRQVPAALPARRALTA